MSLKVSCDTLYFTPKPMDNQITLQPQYENGGEDDKAFGTFSVAVFKVKSTLPEVFRVFPSFGTLLITDGNGEKPSGYKGGDIRISLLRSDIIRTKPTIRFAIEYYILQEESFTYNKLVESLALTQKQTAAARATWNLVASGALQREHVGMRKSIPISVKLADELEALNVSPSARLIDPSARTLSSNQQAWSSGNKEKEQLSRINNGEGGRDSPLRPAAPFSSSFITRDGEKALNSSNSGARPTLSSSNGGRVYGNSVVTAQSNGSRASTTDSSLDVDQHFSSNKSSSRVGDSSTMLRRLRDAARSMKLEMIHTAEKTKLPNRNEHHVKDKNEGSTETMTTTLGTSDAPSGFMASQSPGDLATEQRKENGVSLKSSKLHKGVLPGIAGDAVTSGSLLMGEEEKAESMIMTFDSPFFFTNSKTELHSRARKKKKKSAEYISWPALLVLVFLMYLAALYLRRWTNYFDR